MWRRYVHDIRRKIHAENASKTNMDKLKLKHRMAYPIILNFQFVSTVSGPKVIFIFPYLPPYKLPSFPATIAILSKPPKYSQYKQSA